DHAARHTRCRAARAAPAAAGRALTAPAPARPAAATETATRPAARRQSRRPPRRPPRALWSRLFGQRRRVPARELAGLARIGPDRDRGTQQEHQAGQPDHAHHWVDESLDRDRVATDALENRVQVVAAGEAGTDIDLVGDPVLDRVAALPGRERP